MKGTVTQYVTLGVMLLLMVLIVSMFPEQNGGKVVGHRDQTTTVSKLVLPSHSKIVRAD